MKHISYFAKIIMVSMLALSFIAGGLSLHGKGVQYAHAAEYGQDITYLGSLSLTQTLQALILALESPTIAQSPSLQSLIREKVIPLLVRHFIFGAPVFDAITAPVSGGGGGGSITSSPEEPGNELQANILPVDPHISDIELIETYEQDFGAVSTTVSIYRNNAYRCSAQGYHTFAIVEPNQSQGLESPAFMYVHGGSLGHFDIRDGQSVYVGGITKVIEWDAERLMEFFDTKTAKTEDFFYNDLLERGYRLVTASYCDHDIYTGVGQQDPLNPYWDGTATVDGLLALKAAAVFMTQTFQTSGFILHGTSAGASGAWLLGLDSWYDPDETVVVRGIIPDSFVNSENIQTFYEVACVPEVTRGGKDYSLLSARTGVLSQDAQYYMRNVIADSSWDIPIFVPYYSGDPQCCGAEDLIEEAEGFATNCDYHWDPVLDALAAKGSSLYQWLRVESDAHVVLDASLDSEEANTQALGWIDAIEETYEYSTHMIPEEAENALPVGSVSKSSSYGSSRSEVIEAIGEAEVEVSEESIVPKSLAR